MKYSKAQIIYHWLTVAIIVVMVLSGLAHSYDWIDSGSIAFHQAAGQLFILVLAARLYARLTNPPIARQHTHATLEDLAARIVHSGLYLCLLAYLITGYVAASGLRDPMLIAPVDQTFARSDTGELLLEVHFTIKWVLLALFTVHITAALKHRFWDKDTAMTNMNLTFRKD